MTAACNLLGESMTVLSRHNVGTRLAAIRFEPPPGRRPEVTVFAFVLEVSTECIHIKFHVSIFYTREERRSVGGQFVEHLEEREGHSYL